MSARIGLVIGQLGQGGAERQAYLLARGLAGAGEDVRVFCLSEHRNPYGPLIEEAGVPVTVIARRRSYEPIRAFRLASALRKHKIELVHSFLESATAYCYLASFFYRKAVLLPAMRSLPVDEPAIKRLLLGRALRSSPLVLANSNAGAQAYSERCGVDLSRFEVVANGAEKVAEVTAGERLEARRRFGMSETRPVVGTVGKDDPNKNIPAFLRLVGGLGHRPGGICSVLVGRGLDEGYAVRNGVRRQSTCESYFLGELDDMRLFYSSIDLLVLPSLREGMPNVILEAAAHGVPAVAFDVGGVREAVEHGRTGMIVPAADEAALLEAAAELLEDAQRRKSLGDRAREYTAKKFSVDEMVESTRRAYMRALGQ